MLKRIGAFALALVMAVTPLGARADLSTVLDSLSSGVVGNVNSPGRFQSQARTSFVLGGVEMRAPLTRNAPTLLSFTPPRIDASCAGVSAFFGGFSFINSEEFKLLLKNISAGVAMGFVAHLMLKTLCPQCEAVVQLLQRLNQIASMAAKDACKYGAQMGKAFADWAGFGGPTPDGNAKCGKAAESGSSQGLADDMLQGLNTLCNSVNDMNVILDKEVIARMETWSAAGAPPDAIQQKKAEALLGEGQMGNRTWVLTGAFFPAATVDGAKTRQLIMNLLGTTIYPMVASDGATPVTGSCGSTPPTGKNGAIPCPPTLKATEAMELFMCGVERYAPHGAASTLLAACADTVGFAKAKAQNRKLYECSESPVMNCMHLRTVALDDAMVLNNYVGLNFQVNLTLRAAVARVVNDQRLWDGTHSDTEGRRIVALIQTAPYPLYQAINAAAVYPAAAGDLLDSMTVLVAEQLAVSYFNELFRLAGRANGGSDLSPAMVQGFQDAMAAFTGRVEAIKTRTATNIAVQEGIAQSIRTLNQAIQRQVMSEEIFGSNQFGKGLGAMVSGGTGGAPRTTAAVSR